MSFFVSRRTVRVVNATLVFAIHMCLSFFEEPFRTSTFAKKSQQPEFGESADGVEGVVRAIRDV
jgi:hypothetical protein